MNKQEKQELKRLFMAFLALNGLTLRSWSARNKARFPYTRTYERLSRVRIEISEINEMIKTVDSKKQLKKVKGKWQIK